MSFHEAMKRKISGRVATLDLAKGGRVSRHEAAIAGISELAAGRIFRCLYNRPHWMLQSFYCKAIRCFYRR